jgi:hypothetical protein
LRQADAPGGTLGAGRGEREPAVIASARGPEASNTQFTAAEQAEISARVDQVMGVVREDQELSPDQLTAIERGLDELREASTRVGRKDWLTMVNGAMFSLIVNDLVPQHVVQGAFHLLISGVGHIFGVGGPPPVITA